MSVSVQTNYIYLDDEERRLFTGTSAGNLTFNHPMREIIWMARLNDSKLYGIGQNSITQTIEYKLVEQEKDCMISYNTIRPKCKYWACSQCKNMAIYSYINTWFQQHNTCPACRKVYDFNKDGITYYINETAKPDKKKKKKEKERRREEKRNFRNDRISMPVLFDKNNMSRNKCKQKHMLPH